MPSLEELLLVAFGFSCFYPSSTPRSCPPSWATLVWDVPQLEKGSAPKGITMAEVLYWSIPALCLLLLLLFLSRTYWRKVREPMGTRKGLPRACPAPAGRAGSWPL